MLRLDRVVALAVLALGGGNVQAHLLTDGPGQEPAHGMRLPAAGFLEFLGGRATRPFQQVEDLGGLAAIPCGSALLFALARFGRFLGRGGLLPRLALLGRDVRALFGNTGRFRGFGLRSYADGRRFGLFSSGHVFSFGGDYRGRDMNRSGWRTMQGKSVDP